MALHRRCQADVPDRRRRALFALYVERDGFRGVRRSGAIRHRRRAGSIAAALWLSWACERSGRSTGLTFGLTDKLFDAAVLFDHGYWVKVTRRLVKDLFGPIGIVAAAIGLVAVWRARRLMEIALAPRRRRLSDRRDAGELPSRLLPDTAGQRCGGACGCGPHARDSTAWIGFATRSPRSQLAIRLMAFWLLPMTTLIRSASPHNWYQIDVDRAALCDELRPALHSDDLVAFLSQQSPDVMFCTGSRGWLIQDGPGLSDRLAMALRDGATVVVSPRQAVHTLPPAILATLPVADSADLVAFRVPRATASTSP